MGQVKLNISQSRGYEQYQLEKSREYRNSFVGVKTLLRRYYRASDRNSKNMRKVKERIQELERQKIQFQLDRKRRLLIAIRCLLLSRSYLINMRF